MSVFQDLVQFYRGIFDSDIAAAACAVFLLLEGFAVNALALGGIRFVGGDLYGIQRAVILCTAMMLTLLDGTFDGGVGSLVFHVKFLLSDNIAPCLRLRYYSCPILPRLIIKLLPIFSAATVPAAASPHHPPHPGRQRAIR